MGDAKVVDWRLKRENDGRDLARAMADYCNDMQYNKEAFAEELVDRTHRTLNQSALSLMFATIVKMAESYEKGWYDDRNRAAMMICSEINDFMKKTSPLGDRWSSTPCI